MSGGNGAGRSAYLSGLGRVAYGGAAWAFTEGEEAASIATGRFVMDYAQPNALVQDPLLFVDASAMYQRDRPRYSTQLARQISNLLNRRPVVGQVFDRENAEVDPELGSGLFPILSGRINF